VPDNATITPGSGKTVLADEVTDATLGTGVVQMVKLMDGTLDGTSKAAVGANGLAVDVTRLPPTLEVTGSALALNADVIAATDVSAYRWVSLQLSGTWVGTVTFQSSNDNVTWVLAQLINAASFASTTGSVATVNTLVTGPIQARWFRARVTAYTSGTVVGTAEFWATPAAMQTMGVVPLGLTAHDGVSASNPLQVAGYASLAAPVDVSADGDVVRLWADRGGRLQVGDGGLSLTVDAPAATPLPVVQRPADLVQVANPVANTGVTVTLPAVAGLFHYITRIRIARLATAALAGTAALSITTTNLPGPLAFAVGNAMAAGGTQVDMDGAFVNPLKSSVANTASTIVFPAPGLAVLWSIQVFYYVAA